MKFLNIFSLFYVALAVILLTLNPVLWDQLNYSPNWVWQVAPLDVVQNVLLFFPFGIVLRHVGLSHGIRSHHATVLLGGLLLSVLVESGQLFLDWRTSNIVDLIANSSGALIGSIFHQWMFSKCKPSAIEIPLACLFLPLAWVSAMRSLWEFPAVITVFLSAIASLSLMQSILTTPLHKKVVGSFWISLVLLPMLDINRPTAYGLMATIPVIVTVTAKLDHTALKRIVVVTTVAGLAIILAINGFWYTHNAPLTIWSNEEHLRLSEALLSAMIVPVSLSWYRQPAQP